MSDMADAWQTDIGQSSLAVGHYAIIPVTLSLTSIHINELEINAHAMQGL